MRIQSSSRVMFSSNPTVARELVSVVKPAPVRKLTAPRYLRAQAQNACDMIPDKIDTNVSGSTLVDVDTIPQK